MPNKPIIESIRDFVLECDFLKKNKVNIDYLGVEMSYSIDPLPHNPVVKKYVDGSCIKQFVFAFTSKEAYDGDARTGIENSGFYQKFQEWVEAQNCIGNLPKLQNPKYTPLSIEVIESGYLYDADTDNAQYQIHLTLNYEQEA